MNFVMRFLRGARFAASLWPAFRSPPARTSRTMNHANAGLAGTAAPGSPQDFVVNVGDRVFFESDPSELTPQSSATLDKQAQWLPL